jgi:hypothetical protein
MIYERPCQHWRICAVLTYHIIPVGTLSALSLALGGGSAECRDLSKLTGSVSLQAERNTGSGLGREDIAVGKNQVRLPWKNWPKNCIYI